MKVELIDTKNELLDIFYSANKDFLNKNMDNIILNVSERNLCALLMCELNKKILKTKFNEYFVDVEYNRNKGEVKTIIDNNEIITTVVCDLIIHSRGNNIRQDNLLACEMKKSSALRYEKDKDKNRLIALTKESNDGVWRYNGDFSLPDHVCGYLIGIYYEIDIKNKLILLEIYSEGKLVYEERHPFQYYLNYI